MYQPKINPDAVMLGYLGVDPKKLGAIKGYSTRLTPPSKPKSTIAETFAKMKAKEQQKRVNPYLSK